MKLIDFKNKTKRSKNAMVLIFQLLCEIAAIVNKVKQNG